MGYYRFDGNPQNTLFNLYDSALVRYKRNDTGGAANTIYNACRKLNPKNEDGSSRYNLYQLQPVDGTIEDAVEAYGAGKTKLALQILKHIQLQLHYGLLVA